jgi:hypothetical protein
MFSLAQVQSQNNNWGNRAAAMTSDVNVHKTNSFLRPYFQCVSISKQNERFYS